MLHRALRAARRARARAPLTSGASETSASVVDCAVTSAQAGALTVACARVSFPADAAQHVHDHAAQMAWCEPVSCSLSHHECFSATSDTAHPASPRAPSPQGPLRRCSEWPAAVVCGPLQRRPGSHCPVAGHRGTAVRRQRSLPASDWRRRRRVEPAARGDIRPGPGKAGGDAAPGFVRCHAARRDGVPDVQLCQPSGAGPG